MLRDDSSWRALALVLNTGVSDLSDSYNAETVSQKRKKGGEGRFLFRCSH